MDKSTFTPEDIAAMDEINLAAMVVLHNALGSFKDEAKMCMIELMNRQAAGNTFDFEKYIDEKSKEHQINLNLNSFASTKHKMSKAVMDTVLDVMKNPETVVDIKEDDDDEEDDII